MGNNTATGLFTIICIVGVTEVFIILTKLQFTLNMLDTPLSRHKHPIVFVPQQFYQMPLNAGSYYLIYSYSREILKLTHKVTEGSYFRAVLAIYL